MGQTDGWSATLHLPDTSKS